MTVELSADYWMGYRLGELGGVLATHQRILRDLPVSSLDRRALEVSMARLMAAYNELREVINARPTSPLPTLGEQGSATEVTP